MSEYLFGRDVNTGERASDRRDYVDAVFASIIASEVEIAHTAAIQEDKRHTFNAITSWQGWDHPFTD